MGTDTTGSLITGLNDGMGTSFGAPSREIAVTAGDPSDVLTVQVGSQVVWSTDNSIYYMGLGQNGSTWVNLGSVAV